MDPYKICITLVRSVFYTECYYFMDLVCKILHLVCNLVLSVPWTFLFRTTPCTIMGVVAYVQLLVHYATCCMCDSGDSALKMLCANAAQPIFTARNKEIGWEEAYDILQSQHQYSCCDSPPVKPTAGEVILFAATEASKRSELVANICIAASLSSV